MSTFYVDDVISLGELLDRASRKTGADLLVPDLQRPYVWTPMQVIRLVDSLFRDWPFGSLLLWDVDLRSGNGTARIPHRSFMTRVDRLDPKESTYVPAGNPPGKFDMVLDGQQRVQSLLLAFVGSDWGFRMDDREWQADLHGKRLRGRRGKIHWSRGELYLDLAELEKQLPAAGGDLQCIDFTKGTLKWAIPDSGVDRSSYPRPTNYQDPLEEADSPKSQGRFIRLSRLWAIPAAASLGSTQAFRNAARDLLEKHEVEMQRRDTVQTAIEDLLRKLQDLLKQRVIFLKVARHNPVTSTAEAYTSAVINIFTRLNSAGRTLTQEEITFAWVKSGWNGVKTATECFDELRGTLERLNLKAELDDLMSAIAFVWAVDSNNGKVLTQGDLLDASKVAPMATDLSNAWHHLSKSVEAATKYLFVDRELKYGRHILSFNALAVIWAWYFIADNWKLNAKLTETEKAGWDDDVRKALEQQGQRWLICSHWAGRWGSGSGRYVSQCAQLLEVARTQAQAVQTRTLAMEVLRNVLDNLANAVALDAQKYIDELEADEREQVGGYLVPLWMWHRLDHSRFQQSSVTMQGGHDVDHAISVKLWQKLMSSTSQISEDQMESVHRLGNCVLLKPTFNISKGSRSLSEWLDKLSKAAPNLMDRLEWQKSLLLSDEFLNPLNYSLDQIEKAIDERTVSIRAELKQFVSGDKFRTD